MDGDKPEVATTSKAPTARIGDLLVERGLISKDQLDVAFQEKAKSNKLLGELLVYGPLRDQLGLRRARWVYTGGAPLGADTFRFFRAVGVNLKLLPSGPLPPNPSELIGARRMGQLQEVLRSQADIVIFDSPPALTVTDALVLARNVDGVLVVASSGFTRRSSTGRDFMVSVAVALSRMRTRTDALPPMVR